MSEQNSFQVEHAEKPDDFQAMLVGASIVFFFGVFSFFIQFPCFCLPQILGGLVAVFWFTKKYKVTISSGKGIILGILTCLLGGVAAFIASVILQQFGIHTFEETIATFSEQIRAYSNKSGDSEQVEKIIDWLNSDSAEMVLTVATLGITLVVNTIGGVIGGAIGAAVFKKAPVVPPAAE
ncbi:MAG: DUF4199 family protein [Verrucomicrobia bacterium]|nr:DUF4199 family protein [Verrucomicrobiota bacterium]MDA1067712.1 DUF4199 family protein [Verrucomicrobiota bacterium]